MYHTLAWPLPPLLPSCPPRCLAPIQLAGPHPACLPTHADCANLAAALTVSQLSTPINSVEDLRGKAVGTIPVCEWHCIIHRVGVGGREVHQPMHVLGPRKQGCGHPPCVNGTGMRAGQQSDAAAAVQCGANVCAAPGLLRRLCKLPLAHAPHPMHLTTCTSPHADVPRLGKYGIAPSELQFVVSWLGRQLWL